MKKKLAGLTISIITFIVLIAVVEILLRLLAPVPDPYEMTKAEGNQYIPSSFPTNFRMGTQVEEGLPGMRGSNLFTTNNLGFRGDHLSLPKPANEFRVFMLGGSAFEGFYLDDSQAINSVLQEELNRHVSPPAVVKVNNCAKSGDFSTDHIALLVHRLIHLQPDMIIVCLAVNDLTRSIYNFDYLLYDVGRNSQKKLPFFRLLKLAATEFQIPRRIYYLVRRISSPGELKTLQEISNKSNYRSKAKLRQSAPLTSQRPKTDPIPYRNNLKSIVGICQAHRIRLVLMTQPATWNSSIDPEIKNWQWMLYRNGVTYRADLMEEALESLNTITRQVAAEHSVPLYDLARSIPKSSDFFYDDAHFNVKGAEWVGKNLASFLVENTLIPVSGINTGPNK